jgi:7,8-dihydroneopterin aldolase/epimerase/oxygenase
MHWTISLENMCFFARHGWYEAEREHGNEFLVDVYIQHELQDFKGLDELESTLNYEIVFNIVKNEMNIPAKLLETVCWRIKDGLSKEFPDIKSCRIKIRKKNPPLDGNVKYSAVELEF